MEINNVSSSRSDINEMISKIREVANKSKVFSDTSSTTAPAGGSGFDSILSVAKSAVENINKAQVDSEHLKSAYTAGDSSVTMSQVIIASEKSKLAFEGLVTVRNKILEAYKEIMNMPV